MKITKLLALLTLAVGLQAAPITLWMVTDGAYLAQVDALTGNTTVVGNMGTVLNDIAIDNNGDMWGLDHTGFYKIDRTSGALTFIGAHSITGGNGLGVGPDGFTVYAVGHDQILYTINTGTGASTAVGAMGTGTESVGDIASHEGGLFLTAQGVYSGPDPGGHRLAQIDPLTGAMVGSFGPPEHGSNIYNAKGIASGSDGVLYIGALDTIYAIPSNGISFGNAIVPGVTINVANLGIIRGLASEVPEPGTMALLGLGLVAFGIRRHRK